MFYGPNSAETRDVHDNRDTMAVFADVAAKNEGFEDCTCEVVMGVSREKFLQQYKRFKGNTYFECYDFCGKRKWMVD